MVLKHTFTSDVVLVTGATGGIGRATCTALASAGCGAIAVHYNADEKGAEALVTELRRGRDGDGNLKVEAFKADLGSTEELEAMHASIVSKLGNPTIAILNAGTTSGVSNVQSITDVTPEAFEKTWRVNTLAPFLLARLCLPAMETAGFGRVVFVSSVAGFTGGVVGPHYASSKSALHGLIHWLSRLYCAKGITVNGVAPALVEDTKMLPGASADLSKIVPVGHLGKPDEMAETIMWMLRTGYLTNKVIGVDGGMFVQ